MHALITLLSLASDFPPTSNTSPSVLADLKAELVTVEGRLKINISWAINIDSSIEYLKGTRISTASVYYCEYNPPLAKTNLTGSEQATCCVKFFKSFSLSLYFLNRYRKAYSSYYRTENTIHHHSDGHFWRTDKSCGTSLITSLGFKRLPTSPMVPLVSVLVVYPAENLAFQRAVVALAEFLQWHGGCKVAIDMWQQGKIAELGPIRWLAEQAKAAERVLIVYPQSSSQPSHSPSNHSSPGPSIPAAAHDLYPLILNMVASHSKSAIDLAQFWVVKLGKQQDRSPSNLPLELRGCKTFCLMKDLKKLCRSLYTQRKDDKKKTSDLIFRPGIAYTEKSTVNLREAVEKLGGDPLKSDCLCLNMS
ncbi:hypothetical protein PAMP_011784 [Pampus punctatissimus]